jgi:hypothetical protein
VPKWNAELIYGGNSRAYKKGAQGGAVSQIFYVRSSSIGGYSCLTLDSAVQMFGRVDVHIIICVEKSHVHSFYYTRHWSPDLHVNLSIM